MDVDVRETKPALNVTNLVHGYNKGYTKIKKGKLWRYEKGNQQPFFERKTIQRNNDRQNTTKKTKNITRTPLEKGSRLKRTFNELLCNTKS